VHLAGETDAADLFRIDAAQSENGANRFLGGAPPIGRFLFGPRGLGGSKRSVFTGSGCKYSSILRYEDRARTSGADINSKNGYGRVSLVLNETYFTGPCKQKA
jgi:hypothetical protein